MTAATIDRPLFDQLLPGEESAPEPGSARRVSGSQRGSHAPSPGERRPFTITCVRRHPEHGYWTAHVTPDGGKPIRVDRRCGAWQGVVGQARFEVLPHIAAALQDRVRPLEKQEKREVAA